MSQLTFEDMRIVRHSKWCGIVVGVYAAFCILDNEPKYDLTAEEGVKVLQAEVQELDMYVNNPDFKTDKAGLEAKALLIAAGAMRFVADVCHEKPRPGYGGKK